MSSRPRSASPATRDRADGPGSRPAPWPCSAPVFGPPAIGQTEYRESCWQVLSSQTLVLIDRGFDAGQFLREVAGTGAQFLARCASPAGYRYWPASTTAHTCRARRPGGTDHHCRLHRHLRRRHPIHRELPAGHHADRSPPPSRPPTRRPLPRTLGSRDRLPGTAPHPRRRPRAALVRPAGLEQDVRARAHRLPALRRAIVTAVESRPGTDPDRPASPPPSKPPRICWSTPSTSPPTPPTSSAASPHRPDQPAPTPTPPHSA